MTVYYVMEMEMGKVFGMAMDTITVRGDGDGKRVYDYDDFFCEEIDHDCLILTSI